MNIAIINGPNLNLLGTREPEIYGSMSLADIEREAQKAALELKAHVSFFQSNHEGELVEYIHKLSAGKGAEKIEGMIINAGAYTHTSIAIHDALKSFKGLIIELHISNPMAREAFRHTSYIAPVATASIAGLGWRGYIFALRAMIEMDQGKKNKA